MTKVTMDLFILEDLNFFIPLQDIPSLKEDMVNNLLDTARTPLSVIDMYSQKVIALCGINVLRKGTVEVWSIRSKDFLKYKLSYFKTLYRFIHEKILGEGSNIYRVEIAIDCKEPGYRKWAEKLGGVYEYRAKNYAEGRDHFVFSITREKE